MDVSLNGGTPKSCILIVFSIINHPFWGTTIFGNTHIDFVMVSTWNLAHSTKSSSKMGGLLIECKCTWICTETYCFIAFMYLLYTSNLERYDVSSCFISISHALWHRPSFIHNSFIETHGFRRIQITNKRPRLVMSSADLTNQMLHTGNLHELANYSGW